jgi:hypothetical protein
MAQAFSVELVFLWLRKLGSVCVGPSSFATKQTWLPATTLQPATLGPIEPCRVQCVGNSKTRARMARVPRFIAALRA